ncbi:MAG: 50S ribosomal protein L11 methyltransferase [Clostridia bacterium]|nr:50S ribosomal protein L11 methyltransferase [Clostridia bacterium]MBR5015896.1 50S ribosomal protein L11 methyltransferase [Clostridia bacterium]MBR6479697.1 50S ribosomal protein L11 methyltransferase [Clostridia bacterium]
MDNWTEIQLEISANDIDRAADIANMTVPYGIFIEDYRTLEEEAWEIAHIDLIDEDLLQKDRSKGIIHIYLEETENPNEAIQYLSERLNAEGIKNTISTAVCKNEDWQNKWKENYHPIEIGERLAICPTWITDYNPNGRQILYMDPGLAFGTGSHDTTRLCLETLEKHIKGGETLLDLGCGSGILALAALKLGAKSAVGVDIDPLAAKTAVENGKVNAFTPPAFSVFCGDMTEQIRDKFDVVTANIVADVLIIFLKTARQFMKPNGIFIISGIIDTREEDILNSIKENNFTIKERHESKEWRCFVLT